MECHNPCRSQLFSYRNFPYVQHLNPGCSQNSHRQMESCAERKQRNVFIHKKETSALSHKLVSASSANQQGTLWPQTLDTEKFLLQVGEMTQPLNTRLTIKKRKSCSKGHHNFQAEELFSFCSGALWTYVSNQPHAKSLKQKSLGIYTFTLLCLSFPELVLQVRATMFSLI